MIASNDPQYSPKSTYMNPSTLQVAFLDIRDTLGYVDRPGHLVLFKPSTRQLLQSLKEDMQLRIGIITNLPGNVSHEQGKEMLKEIWELIDKDGFISSHSAQFEKPAAGIYQFACRQMKVAPEQALFIGENLLEVIGARTAGLHAILKPFPPARDFLFKSLVASPGNATNSGRLSETMMEEEHLIGKRIVGAATRIATLITEKKKVPLIALGNLVYLLHQYVDPYHHKKEENILLPFAISRGFPKAQTEWVVLEHDQGRAYFNAIDIAYKRICNGDEHAYTDLKGSLEGFVQLYARHGGREDAELLPAMGQYLSDQDDALLVDLFAKAGPADLTPYLIIIAQMEQALSIK